jgi:hypothetical protein
MQLGFGFLASKTLLSAVELGVFTTLAEGPLETGGFDYTGADCIRRMREAGFAEARVEPLAGDHSMVIGTKWALRSSASNRGTLSGRP